MNLLEFTKTYNLDKEKFCNALGIKVSTLHAQSGKRDIKELTVSQLISIHTTFGIGYNNILGEDIFNVSNIGGSYSNKDTLQLSTEDIVILKRIIEREKEQIQYT